MREAIDYTDQIPIKQIKTCSNFTAKQYEDGCIIINGIRFYGYTAKEAIRLYKDRLGNGYRYTQF